VTTQPTVQPAIPDLIQTEAESRDAAPRAAVPQIEVPQVAVSGVAASGVAASEVAASEVAASGVAASGVAASGVAPSEVAGDRVDVAPAPEPVVSANPAIIALLGRARFDTVAGDREAAGVSLERALRIEPRNTWLWHELAKLRLAQGQYVQAISLAHKSISFSGRDRHLQALNWRVIGNARVAQGKPAEAEQAFKLADELDQPVVAGQIVKPGQ